MAVDGTQSDDEVLFSEVFRRAPDVMSIVRVADAVMLEINDAFEEASGFTREQIIGRSSRDFPWWPNAEQRDAILEQLRVQGRLQDVETCFATPQGELVYLVGARPLLYRGERCAIWRAANVSEQRRIERANRALEERLRQKQNLERLGLLAGGIAHDFNNLLVGVLGNAELLLLRLGEDSTNHQLLEALAKSAQRMADHTRDLLDYAGHTALAANPVRLDLLVDDAAELARPPLNPELQLHVAQRARPAWVHGNAGQLTRMLINLIKGAAEGLEGGQGSVWVDSRVRPGSSWFRSGTVAAAWTRRRELACSTPSSPPRTRFTASAWPRYRASWSVTAEPSPSVVDESTTRAW